MLLRSSCNLLKSGKMATYEHRRRPTKGGSTRRRTAGTAPTERAGCSDRGRVGTAARGRCCRCPLAKMGAYLADRAWGTVREDYSPDGSAWSYFPWEQAISRAYRWNEDGMAGICDDQQAVCLGLSLWNGQDPFLKERLFGLTNSQGNHGEDVKECWWYLDATPTSSWLQWRYHYPQARFPYEDSRGRERPQGPQRPGVRARGHRDLRCRPLLRRHCDVGQAPA